MARLLLCERDPSLTAILTELFREESVAVTPCANVEEIEAALDADPDAIILTDSWTGSWSPTLSAHERDTIKRLAERTAVVVTTGRAWAQRVTDHELGARVAVISKPYDLDEVLVAVRNALSLPSTR